MERRENAEASDLFERIASAEKSNWLPNYYVALVNTTTAFGTKDKDKVNLLLSKAQKALDIEMGKIKIMPNCMLCKHLLIRLG